MENNPRYLTPRQCLEAFPAFTQGGLRWLLFNRASNGLDAAVRKIGTKLLIHEDDFRVWIDAQSEVQR